MYTNSDVFHLTDLFDLRATPKRPWLRAKRIALITLAAAVTCAGVVGVHNVRTSMRHSRVATGFDSLRDAVEVQAKVRGGELVRTSSNSLQSLVGHSAVSSAPWEVVSGVTIDRLAWDGGDRKNKGSRVAVGVTANDRIEASKLYRQLTTDVHGVFRGGQVGGKYRLECGAPSGKSFVICFKL